MKRIIMFVIELQFHVYIFNIEEGMKINYTDGTSKVERTDE